MVDKARFDEYRSYNYAGKNKWTPKPRAKPLTAEQKAQNELRASQEAKKAYESDQVRRRSKGTSLIGSSDTLGTS